MLLAIDIGNTNIVLGSYDQGKFTCTWRIATHPAGTADEFKVKLKTLFDLSNIEFKNIDSVVLSSVVPGSTAVLKAAFEGAKIHVVDHHSPFSFQIQASPASQIGADRLVNAEAAVRDYGVPVIVVDSGTATTLCAISSDRKYLGGAIMPGIEPSIEILAKKTARLFTVELLAPQKAIGHNTETALQSGLLFGHASMIDGMIRRFKEELRDTRVKVIATGGVSLLLEGIAREINHYDPSLTLKGIAYLYESLRRK